MRRRRGRGGSEKNGVAQAAPCGAGLDVTFEVVAVVADAPAVAAAPAAAWRW